MPYVRYLACMAFGSECVVLSGAVLGGNPVIGNRLGILENFHVCARFSGHRMMHAPAAGRAIADRRLYSGDRSIDLSRMGYRRAVGQRAHEGRGTL